MALLKCIITKYIKTLALKVQFLNSKPTNIIISLSSMHCITVYLFHIGYVRRMDTPIWILYLALRDLE